MYAFSTTIYCCEKIVIVKLCKKSIFCELLYIVTEILREKINKICWQNYSNPTKRQREAIKCLLTSTIVRIEFYSRYWLNINFKVSFDNLDKLLRSKLKIEDKWKI